MVLEEKLSYYVDPEYDGLDKEKYSKNFGTKKKLLSLETQKNNGEIVKVYGYSDLLEIIIHPNGTYSFSIDSSDYSKFDLYDNFGLGNLLSQWKSQKILKFQDSSLTHIDDKILFEKIKQKVIAMIKERITKDSYVKSHILHELGQLGYNIDNTQIFNLSSDRYFYAENIEMTNNIWELLEEYYREKNKEEIIRTIKSNYLFKFLDDVFGSESKEYKEALEEMSEEVISQFVSHIAYNQQIFDMFLYCVMKYTAKYSKYISENINTNISLKQAYNALPQNLKVQITEDIFFGDKETTELLDDIIEIFCKKCKQKDGKSYTKKEIMLFLTDISMIQIKNIIPEDFDDSYEEPKNNLQKK